MENNISFLEKLKIFLEQKVTKSRTGQLIVMLIATTVFFSIFEPDFLRMKTLKSMLLQMSELGILTIGVFICILVVGLNTSVTASMNLSALAAATVVLNFADKSMPDSQIYLIIVGAFVASMAVGLLTGIVNGLAIGYLGLPPLLATIGSAFLFTGINKAITKGESQFGFPIQVGVLAGGEVFGIPIPFLLFLGISVIMFFVLRYTKFGYKMFMTGANETTAIYSGINTKDVKFKTFVISGLLAAFPAMIILGRTMSANYDYGVNTYVLFTIFVAIISGSRNGFGEVINVLLAMFVLQNLQTGFNYMLQGVSAGGFFRDFIWGVLLIAFLIVNYFTNVRKTETN